MCRIGFLILYSSLFTETVAKNNYIQKKYMQQMYRCSCSCSCRWRSRSNCVLLVVCVLLAATWLLCVFWSLVSCCHIFIQSDVHGVRPYMNWVRVLFEVGQWLSLSWLAICQMCGCAELQTSAESQMEPLSSCISGLRRCSGARLAALEPSPQNHHTSPKFEMFVHCT